MDKPLGTAPGNGVFAPVAAGVEKFDGNSEVNIVLFGGDTTYLACRILRRASRKPIEMSIAQTVYRSHTFNLCSIANDHEIVP